MQAIESAYVAISATTETERKASNAVVEPILINDMMVAKVIMKRTALASVIDFGDPGGEDHAVLSRESLLRSGF